MRRNGNLANVVGAAVVSIRHLFALCVILLFVSKWCTVTVTEPDGRRHSLDVLAESTYDAAHLFVVEAKKGARSRIAQANVGYGL